MISPAMTATDLQPKETQAQAAHRILEEMIVTLELPPGTRVSELSLSKQLGIGRTPIREALQRLARERTIEIQPRSGAVVTDIAVTDHFKLIEVRRGLEQVLARRAARLADQDHCRQFMELQQRFEQAAADNNEKLFIAADREFNSLIVAVADNVYAEDAIASIQAQTRRFWFLHFKKFGDLQRVSTLHAAIAKAISVNDDTAAVKASDELLDYVQEYTEKTLKAML